MKYLHIKVSNRNDFFNAFDITVNLTQTECLQSAFQQSELGMGRISGRQIFTRISGLKKRSSPSPLWTLLTRFIQSICSVQLYNVCRLGKILEKPSVQSDVCFTSLQVGRQGRWFTANPVGGVGQRDQGTVAAGSSHFPVVGQWLRAIRPLGVSNNSNWLRTC